MGDQFELKRGRRKPILSLPRSRRTDPNTGVQQPPTVEIYAELAKGVAGCCVCNTPIPKSVTRFEVKVRLAEPVTLPNGGLRVHESYYAHSGCLTRSLGGEIPRFGDSCYDCGVPGGTTPDGMTYQHAQPVFATSRFAPGRLCVECAKKPKWRRCDTCGIAFPPWMISNAVGVDHTKARDPDRFNVEAITDLLDSGHVDVCTYCEDRWGLTTERTAHEAEEQWRKVREQIMADGVFGED